MKKLYPISVAIATYNEVRNIRRCLESVVGWVTEIIIVDGGSSDDTIKITKTFPRTRVIVTDNPPIFHINKQKAIDNCRQAWILQLDADEVITPALRQEIINTIADPKHRGYWINRKNYFLGKFLTKGGVYPDATIRLYQRGYAHLPCQDVHEQAEVQGTVGHLKQDLLHYADPTFTRYLLRNDRYTSLIAQQMSDQGVQLNLFSFINYFIIKPILWFLSTYIRHRGYVDGFPGLVFSWYSSLRFPISFTKFYELKNKSDRY